MKGSSGSRPASERPPYEAASPACRRRALRLPERGGDVTPCPGGASGPPRRLGWGPHRRRRLAEAVPGFRHPGPCCPADGPEGGRRVRAGLQRKGGLLEPERLKWDSPGQRPGNEAARPVALKGRNRGRLCRPFRALPMGAPGPRALPWAIPFRSFGAQEPACNSGSHPGLPARWRARPLVRRNLPPDNELQPPASPHRLGAAPLTDVRG